MASARPSGPAIATTVLLVPKSMPIDTGAASLARFIGHPFGSEGAGRLADPLPAGEGRTLTGRKTAA